MTALSEEFPQEPGGDYYLANYVAHEACPQTFAGESDRTELVDIGRTAEGRTL
ncbi:MAG: hypothetical protein MI723_06685 [Caulobacterales bacterium]|nr:hypothetical protein [Caulobacterales bacterium]